MTARMTAALVPIVLACAGCVQDNLRDRLLVSSGPPPMGVVRADRAKSHAPGTEEAARRVLAVGQKIIAANSQLGLRPLFLTVGAPGPEIFHKGGALEGCQVFISDGMVRACATDDQLAAVLCVELGRVVAERDILTGATARPGMRRMPPSVSIGNEVGGTFGSSDGTRMMELAREEKSRTIKVAPANPESLARTYLDRAGYQASALGETASLLRQAEDHYAVEKQLSGI